MHAVILAGGTLGEDKLSNTNKALINFNGVPMIRYVINALRESGEIDKIMVIGNTKELEKVIGPEVDFLIEEKQTMVDNLLFATNFFIEEDQILISTCDIPLLKGRMIADFVKEASKEAKELVYPIIEKKMCQKAFPDVKRTFVTLRDGAFTGGNLVVIQPKSTEKIQNIARLMVENRKNPLKMGQVLGLKFLFLLLIKQLTIKEIEDHLENRFYIRAKAMINNDPEIGNDVDRIEDIKVLEKYI